MPEKFFSIIVVALNPGERLKATLESIWNQSFSDYEIILKDGGSRDGSLEKLEQNGFLSGDSRIRLEKCPDRGIYDAMNQAVKLASGRFFLFLNCGDYLYDKEVLERVAAVIREDEQKSKAAGIYYGNQFNRLQNAEVYSVPEINNFACYRNLPCHQVCFYAASLFAERGYDLRYRIRADYEHFLYCIYEQKVKACYLPLLIASYEGGGFSETAENRKQSAAEHKEITTAYLGKGKVLKYRLLMWLSLAPVRTKLAESPVFSGFYNGVKKGIYGLVKRR
ncbi:MAG: glycosyltransferase [Lachnospiraceae bacterium]|nr:glycosyltransferase [Lachnospiraceae bacterium]